jgi:hypothetical protein
MYRTLFMLWLLIPVVVIAWHIGPGREHLAADRAGIFMRAAEKAESEKRWMDAVDAYAQAAAALPEDSAAQRRQLVFAQAVAGIKAGELIRGQSILEPLIEEMANDEQADEQLLAAVRHEYGKASYHAAWLMRRQGVDEALWKQQLSQAQQQFLLLAEEAKYGAQYPAQREPIARNDLFAYKANLEAAIRLEQIDEEELSETLLPTKCPDCDILEQLELSPATGTKPQRDEPM